jgi:hypothetical protein
MMTGAIIGGKSVEQAARLQSMFLPAAIFAICCLKADRTVILMFSTLIPL